MIHEKTAHIRGFFGVTIPLNLDFLTEVWYNQKS